MFFSAQLCKLPPQCWYFDWQFALSNLQPVWMTYSRKMQICSRRFLFKLKISLGTWLSQLLGHADDNWGWSDGRKCLNNVFIANRRSRRINNTATIKFLFILIWQHVTSTIFLNDLFVIVHACDDITECYWQKAVTVNAVIDKIEKAKRNFAFEILRVSNNNTLHSVHWAKFL